jgi:hypothetical protein
MAAQNQYEVSPFLAPEQKSEVAIAINPADTFSLPLPTHGLPGRDLLHPKVSEPTIWLIFVTIIYTLISLALLIWMESGSDVGDGRRVLRTRPMTVNQFYSGLALSAILTPAAVVIRKLSQEFTKIHPFALTSRKPVLTSNINKIFNPGLLDLPFLWRCSKWVAVVQTVLMLGGTLLVPLGTLIITTGVYAPQSNGTGVVGVPTMANGQISTKNLFDGLFPGDDYASNTAAMLVICMIISNMGVLGKTSPVLGPVATVNITFETGVRYDNLIAFTWEAGCESAEADINFMLDQEDADITYIPLIMNITFDTSNATTGIGSNSLFVWSNWTGSDGAYPLTPPTAPSGGTLFFAIAGDQQNTAKWPADLSTLTNSSHYWISRVKCTPTFNWTVSSCSWDGVSMGECIPSPGANTPWLDTASLEFLSQYMTTVLYQITAYEGTALGMFVGTLPLLYWSHGNKNGNTTSIRAPGLEDYDNFFGAVAQSLVTLATSGYYGTATVPTVGQPETEVYLVRLYMLAIVFLLLFSVAALSIADLAVSQWLKLPFLKADFLVIARAVRGPWWDEELYGAIGIQKPRRFVMFGVDPTDPRMVCLAPAARPIKADAEYYNIKAD